MLQGDYDRIGGLGAKRLAASSGKRTMNPQISRKCIQVSKALSRQ